MGIWLGTARLGAEWAWRHVRDSAWPNAGSGGTSRPLHACLLRVRPLPSGRVLFRAYKLPKEGGELEPASRRVSLKLDLNVSLDPKLHAQTKRIGLAGSKVYPDLFLTKFFKSNNQRRRFHLNLLVH